MNDTTPSRLTSVDEALERLLQGGSVLCTAERVPLLQAAGRILAEDQAAKIDVPGADNSAMDGYALRAADLTAGNRFPVTQRIPAGSCGSELQPGTAVRIFTGAPLPPGADAVVMQENCRLDGEQVTVLQAVSAGENVRRRGDDVAAGSLLLAAGKRLSAADVGLLAACGEAQVLVRRPLRVALLTTGDELVVPGQPLRPGQIYNSNFYTLNALVRALGAEVIDCGIIADDQALTERKLLQAAKFADCIISSGGVSVGEEDHVKNAVQACGQLDLWKLAIKPGKPFAFGQVAGKPFFGLPGNPVSTFVTFVLMVRPYLLQAMGAHALRPVDYQLPAAFTLPKSGSRQEYLRVRVSHGSGAASLHMHDKQGSGIMTSLSSSDGFAVVDPFTVVTAGDMLRYIPFSECLS